VPHSLRGEEKVILLGACDDFVETAGGKPCSSRIFQFSKLKLKLKGRRFDMIVAIQKNVMAD
jgi:hypothetical protein